MKGISTPLDRAHAAMCANEDDAEARLRYFRHFAASELFVLLEHEARGGRIAPLLLEAEGGRYVIAFDRDERLAAFISRPSPHVALSGRGLAAMLAGQGVGVVLNPGVADSAWLVPPGALDWLAGILAEEPVQIAGRVQRILPPAGLSGALIQALGETLAAAAGLARSALLAGVVRDDGRRGHMLVFVEAHPAGETALTRAVHEAVVLSGGGGSDRKGESGAPELDVLFLAADDPVCARFEHWALRFDLSMPEARRISLPDSETCPSVPPKLR